MELKPDLIRDILLYAESLDYNENPINDPIFKSEILSKYSPEQIAYATNVLSAPDANLLNGYVKAHGYVVGISSLTFTGHQYLDDIRDDGVWKETKNKIGLLASVSLPIIQEVAKSITLKKLGL
ncbi:DUF2513 domain-containing protein [Enterococcus dongliensis]|uniref:DUF2513 domain-containing protein n=1 Tax=Enterococcus dongliensis TaxID=2559925 RepID=UPI00288CF2C8|nr:DUF2513 domain-containing protein [Enterococcus dongliensis]MDT2635552.1 DUF2513 domain-containing protein [Enterococcus dongliensis]